MIILTTKTSNVTCITCVTTTKFLGVIIHVDHKYKWNDHITYIKSKISIKYLILCLHYGRQFPTVDICGVEGKRRLCDLNVTSSSPALATRHIRIVLLVNSPNKLNLFRGY